MTSNRNKLFILLLVSHGFLGCSRSDDQVVGPKTEPSAQAAQDTATDMRAPWTATLTVGEVELKDEKRPEQGEKITVLVDIKLPDGMAAKNVGGLLTIKDSKGLKLFDESIVLKQGPPFTQKATQTLDFDYHEDNVFRRPLKHDKNLTVSFKPAMVILSDNSVQNFPST